MKTVHPAAALTLVMAASLSACSEPTGPTPVVVDVTVEVTINGTPTNNAHVDVLALDHPTCVICAPSSHHNIEGQLIGPGLYHVYEETTSEHCGRFQLAISVTTPSIGLYSALLVVWSGCEPKTFMHNFDVPEPNI